jgi:hypothetical protein
MVKTILAKKITNKKTGKVKYQRIGRVEQEFQQNAFYKSNKNPVYTRKIVPNKKLTIGEIDDTMTKRISQEFNKAQKEGKKIYIQLVYLYQPSNIFISTKFIRSKENITTPAQLKHKGYDAIGDEKVSMILFNRIEVNTAKGGYDKNEMNDCLYYSLKTSLGNAFKYENPYKFKKALKLKRNDMIDVDLIPQIEDLLKCNISVEGDHEYQTNKFYPYNCFVELKDNHYSYKANKRVHQLLYSNQTKKELICYDYDKLNKIHSYDGINEKVFENDEQFQDYLNNKYVIVLRHFKNTIQEEYDFLQQENEILKKYNLDLDKSRFSFTVLAKNTFYNTVRALDIDDLTSVEQNMLYNSRNCGLLYSQNGFEGKVKTYDINSYYPYILNQSSFQLPVGRPYEEHLTELHNDYGLPYGLYKVKIEIPENCKYIMNNEKNIYTHFDIHTARELGYNVELIDEPINALLYKNRTSSKKIFNEYIEKMYVVKTNTKSVGSKILLNSLWGSLCQKNEIVYRTNKKEPLIFDDADTTTVLYDKIKYYNKDDYYKLPYARFGVFITSYARYRMYKLSHQFQDKIVRIHTDSFMVKDDFDISEYITIGDGLGEFKEETKNTENMMKSGNVKIIHLNKIVEV